MKSLASQDMTGKFVLVLCCSVGEYIFFLSDPIFYSALVRVVMPIVWLNLRLVIKLRRFA